jgi:hypothetical protein
VPWTRLFVEQTAAVFVFFPQMGLRMALRHMEAMANRPAVPWTSHRSVSPYPFSSWSGTIDRCWDPPVPKHRHPHSLINKWTGPISIAFFEPNPLTTCIISKVLQILSIFYWPRSLGISSLGNGGLL